MTEQTLAGKETITSGLRLGSPEMLRSLRHNLRAQSQGHHTTDRLEERDVERGSARRSSLKGQERAIVNQSAASDFLTTILPSCHRKCLCNYLFFFLFLFFFSFLFLSIGNTQISILLLCFLYLFVEHMITMNEYNFV